MSNRIPSLVKENKKVQNILKELSVKNLKLGFGHDLQGCYCDFYLKGLGKIGYFNDDGWGGEVDIKFETKVKEDIFNEFLFKHKIDKFLFKNGYEFMKSVDKIHSHMQMVEVIEWAIFAKDLEKNRKKLVRDMNKGICYGTEDSYGMLYWKGNTIENLLSYPQGRATIRNSVLKLKKRKETILNTNLDGLEK